MSDRVIKALEFGTLPKFIFKLSHEDFYRNYEADVVSFGFGNPKSVVYEQINPNAEVPLELSDEDIFKFYILSNIAFLNFIGQTPAAVEYAILDFKLDVEESRVFSDLVFKIHGDERERAAIINEIIYERKDFAETTREVRSQYDELQAVRPWSATQLKEVSKNIIYSLVINNSVLGLFDKIVPSAKLPLVTVSNYYKKYKGYDGLIEYPDGDDELLMFIDELRISFKRAADSFLKPTYTVILPDDKNVFGSLDDFIQIETKTFIEDVVNLSFTMRPDEPLGVRLNKFIWADLIMNTVISSDFVLDESARATKYFSTIYMWWLRGDERISFQLSEVMKFNATLKTNETVIDVKVFNIRDKKEHINDFIKMLARALGYYELAAPRIVKEYNLLLSEPIDIEIVETGAPKIRLKNISDIFVADYPRLCQFMPEIVDRDEAAALEEKKYQVMSFPKDTEDPFLFSCSNQPQRPFVGLKTNTLSNKQKYPFVPCCYKQDHRAKKSNYRRYYEGGDEDTKIDISRILSTDKLVKFTQTGYLPADIETYFKAIGEPRPRRRGVVRTSGSIIDCILSKVDPTHASKKEGARSDQVKAVRRTISADILNFATCRQETWNMPIERAQEVFYDTEAFIDAAAFYSLLELYFACRLVVFTRDGFKQPYHMDGYLRIARSIKWPVILVYENKGSRTERLDYPQYELIENVPSLEKVYDDYTSSLVTWRINNGMLAPLESTDEKQTVDFEDIDSQMLNIHGKAVALNLLTSDGILTFYLFEPLPPARIKISTLVYPSREYSEGFVDLDGIGTVKGYFIGGDDGSVMSQFITTRKRALNVVEQAKYIYSKYGAIRFNYTSKEVPYDKWVQDDRLDVPNRVAADRIMYVVKLFEKQDPNRYRDYKDLKYIPYSFTSILDFTRYPDVLIGETGDETESEVPFVIDEPRGQNALFVEINRRVFFCTKVADIPASVPVSIYVWKTRQVLEMPGSLFSIMASDEHFYKMQMVK